MTREHKAIKRSRAGLPVSFGTFAGTQRCLGSTIAKVIESTVGVSNCLSVSWTRLSSFVAFRSARETHRHLSRPAGALVVLTELGFAASLCSSRIASRQQLRQGRSRQQSDFEWRPDSAAGKSAEQRQFPGAHWQTRIGKLPIATTGNNTQARNAWRMR